MATSWRFRVLRNNGTEFTPDLPHIEFAHAQIYGIVRGLWPPKSQIGRLNVPLIPPKGQTQAQTEWPGVDIEAQYAQLKYGNRVERYTRATVWSGTHAYNRNDVVVNPRLQFTFNKVDYAYVQPTSVSSYTFQAGDYVEYDVYIDPANQLDGIIDLDSFDGSYWLFNGTAAVDQNGVSAANADLRPYALGQWYSRKIACPPASVGHASVFLFAAPSSANGTLVASFRNVRVTDGAGTIRKRIWIDPDSNPTFSEPYGAGGGGTFSETLVSAIEYVCILGHTNHTPPNATYWALANPTWTGLLDKLPRDLKTFSFEAQDSWGLHQKAESERKDYFYDTSTNIIKYAITDWTLLYGDDFATYDLTMTDGTLRQYAQQSSPTSGVRWLPAVMDRKQWASISGMEAGRRYVLHNQAAYSAAQLVPSKVDAVIRVNVPANSAVTAGLILGLDPSTGACWQVEFGADTRPQADGTGGAGNLANGAIRLFSMPSWTGPFTEYFPPGPDGGVVAGAAGLTGPAGLCLADGSIQLDYQLMVLPKDSASGGAAGIRVLLNGLDITGSTTLVPGLSMSGAIGLYAYSATGGGTVSVRNWYAFNRGPQMALTSSFPVTTDLIELQFNQAAGLDMLMIAANAGDIDVRKEPRAGSDLVDGAVGGFGAISGGPPTFTEQFVANAPGNLISGQEQDNASLFATQLKVQATSMGGSPPMYIARDLQAIRDYGLWTRQENLEDITNTKVLIAAGDAAAELASDPATSRTIIVEDGPSTVGLWRELSTIRLIAPHLDPALADTMRQVVGYEETEGSPQKTLHLDEYPASMALSDVQKLKSSIDNLIGQALTYRAPPPLQPGPADGPYGWTAPDYIYTTPGGGHSFGGGGFTFGSTGTAPSTPSTGGKMTLIGGGPIPSGITLPLTYIAGDRDVIVSVPFNVYDHPCNVLAFATLACEFASSEAFVKVQLHVGPSTSSVVNESQPTRMGSNATLETGTAMIAPPFTALGVGAYVAWITIEPTGAGTLVDAIGEIQIYCV